MIKTGDSLPDITLYAYSNGEGACAIGPNAFSIRERCQQRKLVIFALPGASHLPVPNVTSPAMSLRPTRFPRRVSTKSSAFPSTMPSS